MRFPRWQSIQFVRYALTLVLIALLASLALEGQASAGAVTTQSVLKLAKSAIAAQSGVHVVFVADFKPSSVRENLVADVGGTGGSESVTEGKEVLVVRVDSSFGYVRGSQSGLTTLFGLSSKQAKALGTRWESWKVGTNQYVNLKADVTLAAVKALLPKSVGTKLSTEIVNGSKSYVLKWTAAASGSQPALANMLTLSAGTFLPTRATTTASSGVKLTTNLSRWGERVQVSAPPAGSIRTSSSIGR